MNSSSIIIYSEFKHNTFKFPKYVGTYLVSMCALIYLNTSYMHYMYRKTVKNVLEI